MLPIPVWTDVAVYLCPDALFFHFFWRVVVGVWRWRNQAWWRINCIRLSCTRLTLATKRLQGRGP
jgi:hypothetical protein